MRRLLLVLAVILSGQLAAGIGASAASDNTGDFEWFIEGPNVVMSADGSTITLHGEGEFSHGHGPQSISGGGEYTIMDSAGNVVAHGNWTMTQFEGFVDYGGLPDEQALRGGTLHAEIQLDGLGTGHIWLYCLIGSPPPSMDEGVRVDIGRWHFDDQVGGETLFVQL